jgi:hypothetical protein
VLQRPYGCGEADLREQVQSVVAAEHAAYVTVVLTAHRLVILTEEVREVHQIGGVGRVRVPGSREIAQGPTCAIMAAVVGLRDECLAYAIRREDHHTTRPAVDEQGQAFGRTYTIR